MPKIISAVTWTQDDGYVIARALDGHIGALGEDEKARDRVGKHVRRIAGRPIPQEGKDPYFLHDLEDLAQVLVDLTALYEPQTEVEWWREQGAPGSDEAVEGLARERQHTIDRIEDALRMVNEAVWMLGGVLDSTRVG